MAFASPLAGQPAKSPIIPFARGAHGIICTSLSAWERGTNEKQNALIRRFFPKDRSFAHISDDMTLCVQDWINHLPRKIFNYRSAAEFFDAVRFDIAI